MVSDASFVEFARSRKTDGFVDEHLFHKQGGLSGHVVGVMELPRSAQ